MPVHAISNEALEVALAGDGAGQVRQEIRTWCAELEAGGVLYFPVTPLPIPQDDLNILLGQQQPAAQS